MISLRFSTAAVAAAIVTAAACTRVASAPAPITRFDILIRGGTVIDGTGAKGYRADVGVIGGEIAAVGELASSSATTTIDANGLIVAPGFINIHSHALRNSLGAPANMLRQGVTTEIGNPDGQGQIPIAGWLAGADSANIAVNYGLYSPFNTIWGAVVGASDRRPTSAQTDSMRALVRRDLAGGAWGVSAGLDYQPAFFATTDEVVAVVDVARAWRTNFPNHDRVSVDNGYSSLAGMRQTVVIGERAGLVPVITHMKLQGHEQGRAREALRMLDSAAQRGVFVAADVYPYLAGQTALSAFLIPGWAADGGRDAMLARFRDSSARARISTEMMEAIRARFGSADNIMVPDRGKNLGQLIGELGVPSVPDAVMALLTERQRGVILTFGIEPDLVEIMKWPNAAIACDCGAAPTQSHPRYYGTFPRVLGRYVRAEGRMTWEEAVRKMTTLPASIIGMVDRGAIAVGMAADLVVFDSTAVIDHATFEKPMEKPAGFRYVLVNGRVVLHDGEPTASAGGRLMRRGASMPSRPPSFTVARSVTVNDPAATIRLTQGPADRSAHGSVRLTAPGLTLTSSSLGLLQSARGWAAISGRGTVNGAESAFILMLDDRDPLAPASSWATVLVPGRAAVRIALPSGSIRVLGG
jgi:N-acyl-D-aspartate/D-glutamate deacylase